MNVTQRTDVIEGKSKETNKLALKSKLNQRKAHCFK